MDLSLSWGSHKGNWDAQAGGASGTPALALCLPGATAACPRTRGGGALASLTLARLLISS